MRQGHSRNKHRRVMRWILLFFACWATTGSLACQKWVPVAKSPVRESDPIERSEDALVILRSGEHVRLSPPIEVADDGLSGESRHNPEGRDFRRARRITIPMVAIDEIRAAQADEVATSLLVVGAVAGALFGTFYLFAQEPD